MSSDRKLSILEMNRIDPSQYTRLSRLPITLLLDNVRSAHNVGAAFRTADAFRIEGIVLVGITPQPPHPLIHKTALGAEDVVPFRYYQQATDAVAHFRKEHYQIWCLEQTLHSQSLESCSLGDDKVLLIVGNEVHGVSDEVVAQADKALEIQQFGTKHSLNVSVSIGIALHHLLSPLFSSL